MLDFILGFLLGGTIGIIILSCIMAGGDEDEN